MTYRSSYEIELEIGFALLEQMEDHQGAQRFRYTPDHGEFEDMMLTGFYGGLVDPDETQEFFVYTLQWPDEIADDTDEELIEVLSSELDSLFPGWVFDEKEKKVYIMRDPDTPPRL